MAALDKILDVMPSARARALTLKAGIIPVFHTDQGTKPVLKAPLQEASILAYLRELADPGTADKIEIRLPCSFVYREFELDVDFPQEGVSVQIHPVVKPAPPPPAAPPVEKPPVQKVQRLSDEILPAAGAQGFKFPIDPLFAELVRRGGSDLHITVGEPPFIRLHGVMSRLEGHLSVTPEQAKELVWPITPEKNRKEYEEAHDTDFAYQLEGVSRFRCNLFMDRFGMGGVFRQIPAQVPSVEELLLSKPVVDLCWLSKGLVLVTGPTGSGKSTTLAALVDFINRKRTDHLITIEDPIEFVHANKKCLINQRQVGVHTESFKRALRAALREDPDIVLVGEMRDLETMAIAIETAETGHLVFGTLHTTTAATTVDRLIDQFPADRQPQIRIMLSECLKGVLSQTLCRQVGGGRICAMEVLIVNSSIANLIREGKTFQIPSLMQTQRAIGNVTLNDALMDLVKRDLVEPQEAYIKSIDKTGLKGLFDRSKISFQMAGEAQAEG